MGLTAPFVASGHSRTRHPRLAAAGAAGMHADHAALPARTLLAVDSYMDAAAE